MELMEAVSSYLPSAEWTPAENKVFENALALFDQDTPGRWANVAALLPGKTVGDVIKQYKKLEDDVYDIEAGLVPIPDDYDTDDDSTFTLGWNGNEYNTHNYNEGTGFRADKPKKKGVPWTEEEHKVESAWKRGLEKHFKEFCRNEESRTPSQVASHAQKYFIRQLSPSSTVKTKRRASIHDITTVNLENPATSTAIMPPQTLHFPWDRRTNNGGMAAIDFNSTTMQGNLFVTPTYYGLGSYEPFEKQGQFLRGDHELQNYPGNQGLGCPNFPSHVSDMIVPHWCS